MKAKFTRMAIFAGFALLGVVLARLSNAQGTWSSSLPVNPATAWLTNGIVIKASNLGPMGSIRPEAVSGITFDTNLSNVATGGDGNDWGSGYIPQNPPITQYYYSGSSTSVSNLVNTWAWAHRWYDGDPDENVYINFTNLISGHSYQLQLMIGMPWYYDAVNLYGPDGEYLYFATPAGQGTNVGMATFTWTATNPIAQFNINLALYDEIEVPAYALIDTTPWISASQFLGGGKFKLTINSPSNETFAVLLSHDLTHWTTNTTVVNGNGNGTFTNSSATSSPTYYRLLEQ